MVIRFSTIHDGVKYEKNGICIVINPGGIGYYDNLVVWQSRISCLRQMVELWECVPFEVEKGTKYVIKGSFYRKRLIDAVVSCELWMVQVGEGFSV